jgi:hypothetical protein
MKTPALSPRNKISVAADWIRIDIETIIQDAYNESIMDLGERHFLMM